ncbi:MAG: AraC family transcriptional regulator [Pseudomonadota bacterium]
MPIPPKGIVQQRLTDLGAEVHSIQIDSSNSIMMYDASYEALSGPVPNVPALFVLLCVSGGGRVCQKTSGQDFDAYIEPGDIGIAAPSSPGFGSWPELRVIGLGVEVKALVSVFGDKWPNRLRHDVISKPFHDPLVEKTMMQIGYSNPGMSSDSVLKYAAFMIVHQLLDEAVQEVEHSDEIESVVPLSRSMIEDIDVYVGQHIDRQILVDELAKISGLSRHHFSRRFKATTGNTPYQYVLQKKLDAAAEYLASRRSRSVIDVAQSVGFESPAQFAKAFRRRFGQTPRFWRTQRLD